MFCNIFSVFHTHTLRPAPALLSTRQLWRYWLPLRSKMLWLTFGWFLSKSDGYDDRLRWVILVPPASLRDVTRQRFVPNGLLSGIPFLKLRKHPLGCLREKSTFMLPFYPKMNTFTFSKQVHIRILSCNHIVIICVDWNINLK